MNPTPLRPPVALLGDLREPLRRLVAGDLAEAWNLTLTAIKHRPFHPEAWWLLADVARSAGEERYALDCARQAKTLAPGLEAPRPGTPTDFKQTASAAPLLPPPLPSATDHPRLSVCVITRNEERFIEQCLKSVSQLAWQIVVVDTGSTDSTPQRARDLGAEVLHAAWTDDFSAARNTSLLYARGDWILILDADEELKADAHEQLLLEMKDASAAAYRLPMWDAGRAETGSYHVPRLFRNAPGLHYTGRIHEQIFPALEPLRRAWGLENRLGKTGLLHHGYSPEITRERRKDSRNLRLLELALEEHPADPNLRLNHGLELFRANRPGEGLREYWNAFNLLSALPAAQVSPELRETLLTQLATRLVAAKKFQLVTRILQSPLAEQNGLTATQHYLLGLSLVQTARYREAAIEFRSCLKRRREPTLTPVHQEIHGAAPSHCLAVCLQATGQTEEAEAAFLASLRDEPGSERARLDWASFLAGQNRLADALNQICHVMRANPNSASAWELGGSLMLSRRELDGLAEEWTSEAISRFPNNQLIARHRAMALGTNREAAPSCAT